MVMVQDQALQVLIIEDDDNTADVIRTLLRDVGYQPEAVDSGSGALDAIAASTPDLILLDLRLPDMHGLDVLRAVRAHSFLPIIVLSGFGKDGDRVAALLDEHGVPADALEIELTETVLQTGAATIEGLRRLQRLGITVALDDFGTGYSSLTSLEQLPLNRVKLDRSLIAGIDGGGRSASIASAIIDLCRGLGVQVTAEGVERPEQLAMLREAGITVQGFLLSRPVPEASLPQAIDRIPALLQQLLPAQTRTLAEVVPLSGKQLARRRSGIEAAEGQSGGRRPGHR